MGLMDDFRLRPFGPASESVGLDSVVDEKVIMQEEPVKVETRYSFFSPWLNGVIHADNILLLQSLCDPFNRLMETGRHSGLWWLHVTSPSNEDIEMLSRLFDIHPLTTEDIKMREVREKIELFGPYYFLSLRPPRTESESVMGSPGGSANFYGIVFPDGILSISFDSTPHPPHVWSRIKEHQSHLSLTSDWICYALMYDGPRV